MTLTIEFHLYDRDCDRQYKREIDSVNKRNDGSYGTLTTKREIENYIPRGIVEEHFEITLQLEDVEYDDADIANLVSRYHPSLKEQDIKRILCGCCAKKITRVGLEDSGAWDEVKGWFEKINELCCMNVRSSELPCRLETVSSTASGI